MRLFAAERERQFGKSAMRFRKALWRSD